MNRKELLQELIELQSDEFESKKAMYLTKKQIIRKIIQCAHYYKEEHYCSQFFIETLTE
jgi:hypothetical protein